jgi:hypothetical protein
MDSQTVRHYCIQIFAKQIHDGVGHIDPANRALDDWLAAEAAIDARPGLIDIFFRPDMWPDKKVPTECGFEQFSEQFGRCVWNNCYQSSDFNEFLKKPFHTGKHYE